MVQRGIPVFSAEVLVYITWLSLKQFKVVRYRFAKTKFTGSGTNLRHTRACLQRVSASTRKRSESLKDLSSPGMQVNFLSSCIQSLGVRILGAGVSRTRPTFKLDPPDRKTFVNQTFRRRAGYTIWHVHQLAKIYVLALRCNYCGLCKIFTWKFRCDATVSDSYFFIRMQ